MRSAAEVDDAAREMLRASLPPHLLDEVGVRDAKDWVAEHLGYYDEEKFRFPDQVLLPWSNLIGYDGDWERAFFVVLVLHADVIELFCGTGYWPDIRGFGEGEAEELPATELYREWAARFSVPSPPVRLTRAEVAAWLGREW